MGNILLRFENTSARNIAPIAENPNEISASLFEEVVSYKIGKIGKLDNPAFNNMLDFLKDYNLLNGKISYQINGNNQIYLNAENLLDENYETAGGFSTSSRAFYVGYKTQF